MAVLVHFLHRHVWDTVVILEEGNLPHPRFPLCNILVTWRSLNGMNRLTVQFKKGAEKKRPRLVSEEERAVISRAFSAYVSPLDMVTSFKYVGRFISAVYDDWPEVLINLAKERAVWGGGDKDSQQGGGGAAGVGISF